MRVIPAITVVDYQRFAREAALSIALVENVAVGPNEPPVEGVPEGKYDPDSNNELVIAPELLDALRQPLVC